MWLKRSRAMYLCVSLCGTKKRRENVLTSPKPPFPKTRYCLNVFFVTGCLLDRKGKLFINTKRWYPGQEGIIKRDSSQAASWTSLRGKSCFCFSMLNTNCSTRSARKVRWQQAHRPDQYSGLCICWPPDFSNCCLWCHHTHSRWPLTSEKDFLSYG